MKKALAFSALPLVLLLVTAFQSSNSVPGQLAAILAKLNSLEAKVASSVPRQFYLTKTHHQGSQALSACAPGYHMASMVEIADPTNLRYNTELGFTLADSGLGAPTGVGGWIRTGFVSAGNGVSGESNCLAWTSSESFDFGTTTALAVNFNSNAQSFNPWIGSALPCGEVNFVWCVQD